MSTNHTQVKLGAVFHRTEVLKFTGSSRGKVEREREVGGGRGGGEGVFMFSMGLYRATPISFACQTLGWDQL